MDKGALVPTPGNVQCGKVFCALITINAVECFGRQRIYALFSSAYGAKLLEPHRGCAPGLPAALGTSVHRLPDLPTFRIILRVPVKERDIKNRRKSLHFSLYWSVLHSGEANVNLIAPTIRLPHDDILARHQKHLIIIIIIYYCIHIVHNHSP